MKIKLLSYYLFFFLFVLSIKSFGQTSNFRGLWWNATESKEYLVSIDPKTAEKTLIKSIPNVQTITDGYLFNTDSSQYVFVGQEGTSARYYYILNAQTGDLLSKHSYPEYINYAVYNPQQKNYCGLYYNTSDSKEYFVNIDPRTATRTNINTIPGVQYITGGYILNTDSNQYTFLGKDGANISYYYMLDALTGSVISQAPFTEYINYIIYSPVNKNYCGLWYNTADSKEYFVSIDLRTAQKTIISAIPNVQTINDGYVFNPDNNEYTFMGKEGSTASDSLYYYTLNAATGNLIARKGYSEYVNYIGYFSNGTATGIPNAAKENNTVSVYPNPFNEQVIFDYSASSTQSYNLVVYDIEGREVRNIKTIANSIRLERGTLQAGVYLYKLLANNELIKSGQLIAK